MFKTSESTSKLDQALAKAQGQIEAAAKDKQNPHFKSFYADLTAVWDACRVALRDNQIAVTQWPVHSEDSRVHLVTRISHEGEWMQGEFSIPADKQTPQGYGSAISYAKRYCLAAALGVVAEMDDDGNQAEKLERERLTRPKPTAVIPSVPNELIAELKALATKKGWGVDQVKDYSQKYFKKLPSQLSEAEFTLLQKAVKTMPPVDAIEKGLTEGDIP